MLWIVYVLLTSLKVETTKFNYQKAKFLCFPLYFLVLDKMTPKNFPLGFWSLFPPFIAPPVCRCWGSKETHIYLKIKSTTYLLPTPHILHGLWPESIEKWAKSKGGILGGSCSGWSKGGKNLPAVLPGLAQLLKWEKGKRQGAKHLGMIRRT